MVKAGVTPLDGVFGTGMDWVGSHPTVVLTVVIFALVIVLSMAFAEISNLRAENNRLSGLIKLVRAKNDTLDNYARYLEGKPK